MKKENEISKIIIDSAIEVHRTIGGRGYLKVYTKKPLCGSLLKERSASKGRFLCP